MSSFLAFAFCKAGSGILMIFDNVRLSYQHFVWREHLGYNIHPSIVPDLEDARSIDVDDVGTGHW